MTVGELDVWVAAVRDAADFETRRDAHRALAWTIEDDLGVGPAPHFAVTDAVGRILKEWCGVPR